MAMEVTIMHCEWNRNLVVFYALERCLTAYYVKHIYLKLQHHVYASSIVKVFFCRQTLVVVSLRSLNWDKFPRYKNTVNVVMMVNSLPFGVLPRQKMCTTFRSFSIQCCKSTQLYCCLIWNNKFGISVFIFHEHVSIHAFISETVVIFHWISKLSFKIMNSYQMLPGLY